MEACWAVNLLSETPDGEKRYSATSVYFSTGTEVEENPQLNGRTSDFRGVRSWGEVALQVLKRVGWRPDCALPQAKNLCNRWPPRDDKGGVRGGTRQEMADVTLGRENASYMALPNNATVGMQMKAGAFFYHHLGYSVTMDLEKRMAG